MKRGDAPDSRQGSLEKETLVPHIIVTYSLKKLPHTKKTMFGYALKGRDNKSGILHEARGKALGRNCFRVPVENAEKVEEFMEYWKVDYRKEKAYFVYNQQKRVKK